MNNIIKIFKVALLILVFFISMAFIDGVATFFVKEILLVANWVFDIAYFYTVNRQYAPDGFSLPDCCGHLLYWSFWKKIVAYTLYATVLALEFYVLARISHNPPVNKKVKTFLIAIIFLSFPMITTWYIDTMPGVYVNGEITLVAPIAIGNVSLMAAGSVATMVELYKSNFGWQFKFLLQMAKLIYVFMSVFAAYYFAKTVVNRACSKYV